LGQIELRDARRISKKMLRLRNESLLNARETDMNDQARDALGRLIQNYGQSICHTPRSCELFLRKECSSYPEESRVLIEALRGGVATELLRYQPDERPWQEFFGDLRTELHKRSGLKESEGSWAIDAWARALGRHPEAWVPTPEVMALARQPIVVQPGVSRGTLVAATTFIVGTGGALGGALGAMLVPAAVLLTQTLADMPIMKETLRRTSSKDVWMIVILILAIVGAIGGVGGGLGAALGWLHGKGDMRPWRGFTVALGATFTTTAISGYFCGIFGWFFGALASSFSSSRACASRGGYV
jgi:hypothetical protein